MFVWGEKYILFKGERFKAYAEGKGNELVLCTPIVFDDDRHCGTGIIVGNEVLRWGLFAPRDCVASWRAGEILRVLGYVNSKTIRGAYYAASRGLNGSKEVQCYTAPIISQIGVEKYKSIMLLPIPEKVVRAILDNRQERDLRPNLYPLTEEVEAGTLVWRDEFSKAGVLTPEEHQTKRNEWKYETVVFETDNHLYSIIDVIGLDRMSMGIHEIRNILSLLFEKKANEKYPSYALVALAVIMSDTTTAQTNSFESFKIFERVAQWVSRVSGYPRINLFGIMPIKRGALSPKESSNLLQELVNRYFPIEKNLMGL